LVKILHINNIAGGKDEASRLIEFIASALVSGGDSCVVASAYGNSGTNGVGNLHVGNSFDHSIHKWITKLTDAHGFQSVRATGVLTDRIVEIKPNLVHLHNLHGYYIHLPLLADFLNRSHLPVVLTLHDYWLLTGHCLNPFAANCDKFLDGKCGNCPQTGTYPSSWRDNSRRSVKAKVKALRDMDNLFIVANSQEQADMVHKSWLGSHPIFVISHDNYANGDKNDNFAEDEAFKKMAEAYLELYKNLI
jgi:hypothetical protein